MASVWANQHGRLRIAFRYKGRRCTEGTRLKDTIANRRHLERLGQQIEAEILTGVFDYGKRFSDSPNVQRFAPQPRPSAIFGEFAAAWLDGKRPWLRTRTAYDYGTILGAHLLPAFGALPVSEISEDRVRAFVKDLQGKSGTRGRALSNRRINIILIRLHGILKQAVRKALLAQDPMASVPMLREVKPDIDPFSFEEVKRFLESVPDGFRAYFTTACFSGLRPSEQLAARPEDVDWVHGTLRVRAGIIEGREETPKTDGSYRDVDLLPMVRDALRAQAEEVELFATIHGRRPERLFFNQLGGPLNLTNLRERVWRPTLRRAGLRARTMYQTRHSFATLMLGAGEQIGWVAQMLGHTSVEMVIRRYHKFIPNLTRRDGSAFVAEASRWGLVSA